MIVTPDIPEKECCFLAVWRDKEGVVKSCTFKCINGGDRHVYICRAGGVWVPTPIEGKILFKDCIGFVIIDD